ncbi:MAG: orotidine-5'-phosphate decarboxylase [Fimbriimonadaceae bacterium]|nr:orotidine-5'-phosphate decarboxylase [Fimbriimonadaceae bacterium]QYK59168.1 MAG: orotidine-5'-phosphate decarboxylase [Fimbriimonadaceae bacterium]
MRRKVICAIDTGDLSEALSIVRRVGHLVGAFKIGHALTLPHGLNVIETLREAGADRIFLDLKFHDIPNSVALGVREAARHGAWMTTLHLSGGPAMLTAAVEEAREYAAETAPLLIGVSVLTSLDEACLHNDLGVGRSLEDHMLCLSQMGIACGLDGVVCSVREVPMLRRELGHAVIVTPGIRRPVDPSHDQQRTGDAQAALRGGADYLVIGRVLTDAPDPSAALASLGLLQDQPA